MVGSLGVSVSVDPIVYAGGLITAFVAGCGVFYQIGRTVEGVKHKVDLKSAADERVRLEREARSNEERIKVLEGAISRPLPPEQATKLVQTLLHREDEVWLSCDTRKPNGHDATVHALAQNPQATKIISVANLKGGVGKTTIAANLAAYLDKVAGKRVLVIDADYQGSLSDVMKVLGQTTDAPATTAQWLQDPPNLELLVAATNRVSDKLSRTRFLSAFYEFSSFETRVMVEWLIAVASSAGVERDLRYALARVLHSPTILSRFDVVIIDCPPRLSTATINALCASTHLLIPAVPDNSTLEATANFLRMARNVTRRLNPALRLAGVVPSLTHGKELTPDEKSRLDALMRRADNWEGQLSYLGVNVPHTKPIADVAGTNIAVLSSRNDVKQPFVKMGEAIWAQLTRASANAYAVAAE